MFGNLEQSYSSNQQKIQTLKQKIKNIDSLYPKATMPSGSSSQPLHSINEYQQPKIFSKTVQKETFLPIEVRYYQLEEKFGLRFQNEEKILENIDNELQLLQEETRLNKKTLQKSRELRQEKLAQIEKEINDEVHQQIQQTKAIRKEIIESIQKKYKTIKSETMGILGNHFQIGWYETRQEIIGKIEDVRAKMDLEQTLRDEEVTSTVNKFGQQIMKLEQLIQKQKDQRIQSHQKLLNSILQMQQSLGTLMYHQKKESTQGIAELESNLEQLCFKIQNYLLR